METKARTKRLKRMTVEINAVIKTEDPNIDNQISEKIAEEKKKIDREIINAVKKASKEYYELIKNISEHKIEALDKDIIDYLKMKYTYTAKKEIGQTKKEIREMIHKFNTIKPKPIAGMKSEDAKTINDILNEKDHNKKIDKLYEINLNGTMKRINMELESIETDHKDGEIGKLKDKCKEIMNKYNIQKYKYRSMGEILVHQILYEIYGENDSIIFYEYQQILIVGDRNYWNDFYILLNKDDKIRELIIEYDGGQHYCKTGNMECCVNNDLIKEFSHWVGGKSVLRIPHIFYSYRQMLRIIQTTIDYVLNSNKNIFVKLPPDFEKQRYDYMMQQSNYKYNLIDYDDNMLSYSDIKEIYDIINYKDSEIENITKNIIHIEKNKPILIKNMDSNIVDFIENLEINEDAKFKFYMIYDHYQKNKNLPNYHDELHPTLCDVFHICRKFKLDLVTDIFDIA